MKASSAVIAFPKDRLRPAAARELGPCSAEIVIFSGVRVERMTDEPKAECKLTAKNHGLRR
jgi:hypothetical protein